MSGPVYTHLLGIVAKISPRDTNAAAVEAIARPIGHKIDAIDHRLAEMQQRIEALEKTK